MAGPSNNASFIPKRGASKRSRKSRNKSVYVLTIISYILLFATLLASLGVYIYGRHIEGQLQKEISTFNAEVSGFKEADMQRVQEFDIRLRQAQQRLANSVSITSIFDALEAATIDTVRLNNLLIERNLDDNFELTAEVETDTFDSSLFQRGVFKRNKVVNEVEITNVTIKDATTDDGEVRQSISFNAYLGVPLSSVPYIPSGTIQEEVVSLQVEATEQSEATSTEAVQDEESNNDAV